MVDLKKVFSLYPDSKNNSVKLNALLRDLFPNETKRNINIIISLMESGYVNRLASLNRLSEKDILLLISEIENEYGFKEEYILEALYLWAEAYGISYQKITLSVPETKKTNNGDNSVEKPLSNVIIDNEVLELSFIKVIDPELNNPFAFFNIKNKTSHTLVISNLKIIINGMTFGRVCIKEFLANESKVCEIYLISKTEIQLFGYNDSSEVDSLDMQFSYSLYDDSDNLVASKIVNANLKLAL